jgi:hypothetical protein
MMHDSFQQHGGVPVFPIPDVPEYFSPAVEAVAVPRMNAMSFFFLVRGIMFFNRWSFKPCANPDAHAQTTGDDCCVGGQRVIEPGNRQGILPAPPRPCFAAIWHGY